MSDDKNPERPVPRLPPSGTAEEILGRLARCELADEPAPPEEPPDNRPLIAAWANCRR